MTDTHMNVVPALPGYKVIMCDFEDKIFFYYDVIAWALYKGKGTEEDGVDSGYVLSTPVTVYGEQPFSFSVGSKKHIYEMENIGVGLMLPNGSIQAVGGEIISSPSEFEKKILKGEIAY